ncbi:MAG: HD domain-containing protein [Pirellulales bacterium]|nr:HD domain-containing protein [Pirellulales bacterium]
MTSSAHLAMIRQALAVVDAQSMPPRLPAALPLLFDGVYSELEKGIEQNPIEHHLVVLKHAMEIAVSCGFDEDALKRAAAIAMLHDIAPVRKVTSQAVAESQRIHGDVAAASLEELRRSLRIRHMEQGAEQARTQLLRFNRSSSEEYFNSADIDAICGVIAIHDNPSVGIPIPSGDLLAVVQREADRLWMVTLAGVETDLRRAGKDPANPVLRKEQVQWNIDDFRKERKVYNESAERFCDAETFFRTKAGWEIYKKWRTLWEL